MSFGELQNLLMEIPDNPLARRRENVFLPLKVNTDVLPGVFVAIGGRSSEACLNPRSRGGLLGRMESQQSELRKRLSTAEFVSEGSGSGPADARGWAEPTPRI